MLKKRDAEKTRKKYWLGPQTSFIDQKLRRKL